MLLKKTQLLSFAGNDRGPVLEVIVSRTNFISSHTSRKVRVVGLSTALANARDLADWLGIGQVRFFGNLDTLGHQTLVIAALILTMVMYIKFCQL